MTTSIAYCSSQIVAQDIADGISRVDDLRAGHRRFDDCFWRDRSSEGYKARAFFPLHSGSP
ncbi:hypothetical protein [uncultured Ruegeria sp.]|uniref:hypothetical protein n=1 Tax=uncultured Ruegeria sp. TaxID=259304 RepID=UPI0026070D1F|nr:hypothetical protein [uncultured Ruegeria sp.]